MPSLQLIELKINVLNVQASLLLPTFHQAYEREEQFWCFSVVEDVVHVLFANPPHCRSAPYSLSVLWQSSVVFRGFDTLWGFDRELDPRSSTPPHGL